MSEKPPKKEEEISFPWMGKSMEHEAEEVVPLSPLKAEDEEKIKVGEEKMHFPKGAASLEAEENQIISTEPLPGTGKRGKMGRVPPLDSEFEKAEFSSEGGSALGGKK